MHTALRNRILNMIRNKMPQEKYWNYYRTFIPQQQDTTDQVVAFDDLNDAVELAVSHLPEKSRQVFKLSRLEGRSNAEIANLLQVSEKAIEYHLTKSLKELRLHLKDFMT
ncbi:MAG: sigma-70 family RNA polymerase sigma factor [Cyclobacteriaceae bacterium]